eukprot:gene21293-biopygen8634
MTATAICQRLAPVRACRIGHAGVAFDSDMRPWPHLVELPTHVHITIAPASATWHARTARTGASIHTVTLPPFGIDIDIDIELLCPVRLACGFRMPSTHPSTSRSLAPQEGMILSFQDIFHPFYSRTPEHCTDTDTSGNDHELWLATNSRGFCCAINATCARASSPPGTRHGVTRRLRQLFVHSPRWKREWTQTGHGPAAGSLVSPSAHPRKSELSEGAGVASCGRSSASHSSWEIRTFLGHAFGHRHWRNCDPPDEGRSTRERDCTGVRCRMLRRGRRRRAAPRAAGQEHRKAAQFCWRGGGGGATESTAPGTLPLSIARPPPPKPNPERAGECRARIPTPPHPRRWAAPPPELVSRMNAKGGGGGGGAGGAGAGAGAGRRGKGGEPPPPHIKFLRGGTQRLPPPPPPARVAPIALPPLPPPRHCDCRNSPRQLQSPPLTPPASTRRTRLRPQTTRTRAEGGGGEVPPPCVGQVAS